MPVKLLDNPELFPTDKVISEALLERAPIFDCIKETAKSVNNELVFEWNYYKDGKAWLCKVILKKKTIFWLSLWEGSIKVTFYYSDKNKELFLGSNIDSIYKEMLNSAKAIGKITPLTLSFCEMPKIDDFKKLIEFKIKH